jgi:hypothetical protein
MSTFDTYVKNQEDLIRAEQEAKKKESISVIGVAENSIEAVNVISGLKSMLQGSDTFFHRLADNLSGAAAATSDGICAVGESVGDAICGVGETVGDGISAVGDGISAVGEAVGGIVDAIAD